MRLLIFFFLIFSIYNTANNQVDKIHVSNSNLYGEINNGLPKRDSIIELKKNNIVIGKGAFAINKYGVSNLKVGYWKEYFDNGILKMEGKYKLGSYTSCCTAGPCKSFYYFRSGLWKIYNETGELKYELVYEPTDLYIDTTCEGGDKLVFGILNEIPLKYLGDLTCDKIFNLQKIIIEYEYGKGIWTPLNGRLFIESK